MSKDTNKIKGWGLAEKFVIWTIIIVILLDFVTGFLMQVETDIMIVHILIEGVLGVFMMYIVGNYLTRPIRTLLKGVEEIGSGNLEYKIEPGSADEIYTLSKAFNQMSYNLNKSISELRTSEEKYRNLVELTTDIIYLSDREGNQIFMNEAAYRILEANPEEVIGQPWLKWIHPEEREKTLKKFTEMIEKDIDIINFENRYISKSGRDINVLHNVRVLRNEAGQIVGTHGIARDITERKRAEEALHESEKKYRTLIENIQDGVFIIQDAKIQFANEAFARIVGYTLEEVIGVDFRELVAPEYLEMVTDRYYRRQAGENVPQEYEFCLLRRDGKTRIVNMNVGLINYRGRVASMGTVKDITEKKMLEMQLLQSDKLATIGQLAAGVAHEINNPLGNISLYTQMLLKKTENKNTGDKLMVINDEANRAAKIVKGLLDFARQSELKLSHVDINTEIETVLSIMNPQLKKIKVDAVLSPLAFVLADSGQIQQVIMNLLVNSIQAIAEDGEIIVKTAAKNDHIEISISDNGCGIPQENLDKIFDPFFTTKGQGKGTGLGLSICYGIIKRHNGSIDVKSEPGEGTTFTIKLPA